MKMLGLVGGTSWVSTVDYYRLINEGVNKVLGASNFARCIIHSFNYQDIINNNNANDWDKTLAMVTAACNNLENSGAEGIVLCANTMHLIADRLQNQINLPIIHIAEETGKAINLSNLSKVALLGTKFTMEREFYHNKLAAKNIKAIIPDDAGRDFIHYTIFEELGHGIIKEESKQRYLEIINALVADGAEGVILGCTEIPLIIKQGDIPVPAFDTTEIHAAAAVKFALS